MRRVCRRTLYKTLHFGVCSDFNGVYGHKIRIIILCKLICKFMQITHDLDSQRDSVHGDGEDTEGKLRCRLERSLQRVRDACVGQGAATSMCNDDADWLRAERAAACVQRRACACVRKHCNPKCPSPCSRLATALVLSQKYYLSFRCRC